mgnify:CR=1 FL=1
MSGEQSAVGEERVEESNQDRIRGVARGLRLVPPAVTPLRTRDVVEGIVDHARGTGRADFGRAVAAMLDARAAATYSSYRRALAACLRSIAEDRPERQSVLVPAFCSPDFPDAIEGVGLAVERYDVDPRRLAADTDDLAARLAHDTLAVVSVSPLGYASAMDDVAERCRDADVPLVEAIGYAIGSSYEGRPIGAYGDYAVVNFQEGKPIPVGGGMVVDADGTGGFSDAGRPAASPNVVTLAGYAAAADPRVYGLYQRGATLLARFDLLGDRVTTHPGSKQVAAYDPPFATMSNFQCAVGRRVLDRLDANQRRRAATARYYRAELRDLPGIDHLTAVSGLENHQHVRYPLVAGSAELRDAVLDALDHVGVQATPLYDSPTIDPDRFPGAASLQGRLLTLPTHPYVDASDRRTVVETVRAVVARR